MTVPAQQHFDVVVVGGGGSGLAAAIEAATLGRSVVLLEKNAFLGGSTARSIGSISATNTPHQLRRGIKDSPEEHFEDLGKFNAPLQGETGEDNHALRRILVENVPETFRWLMSMGVSFFGPTPEPPHRKPRMHNVLPNSKAYAFHLERRARKVGVDIRTERRAVRFLLEGNHATGIECSGPDGRIERYMARGGIVLASGDYSADPVLKERFGGPRAARVGPTNPTNTGDGHKMVIDLGGRVINGQMMLILVRFVAPTRRRLVQMIPPWRPFTRLIKFSMETLPSRLLRPFVMSFLTTVLAVSPELFRSGAILVNKSGRRFGDELDKPVFRLAEQEDQTAYMIFDEPLARKYSAFPHFVSTAPGIAYAYVPDYQRSRPDIFAKAETLDGLASKLGIDPAALRATLDERNASFEVKDGRFPRLEKGPFYAMGPIRSFANITDGGVAINEKFEVLGAGDVPIEALYAAGSAGQGGVMLEGHGHHLGWAFTSGRLAGRNAAYRVTSKDL